jgi:hypothetical protein
MNRVASCVLTTALLFALPAAAQDYRGRVQGSIADETRAVMPGFSKLEQKNVRVQQPGSVTLDIVMTVGGVEQTVSVSEAPSVVEFKSTSSDLKLEHELLDQVPISGRNVLDPIGDQPRITRITRMRISSLRFPIG